MTKTNGLVNVILKRALSAFPVDSERYELTAAVRLNAAYSMQHLGVYEHENWRINEWLVEADSIVWGAVEAFVNCSNSKEGDSLPEDENVLAVAVMNSISKRDLDSLVIGTLGDDDLLRVELYTALWKRISATMRNSRDHVAPGNTTREILDKMRLKFKTAKINSYIRVMDQHDALNGTPRTGGIPT